MNKKHFTLFLIIMMTISASMMLTAQENENRTFYNDLLKLDDSEVLSSPSPGDYIIYESSFAETELIVTVLYLGNREFFFKTFNKENYGINEFKAQIINNNGRYEIGSLNIKSGNLSNTDLQLTQLDFLKMLNARTRINTADFPKIVRSSEKWEDIGTTFQYEFRFWVPIANLFHRFDVNNRQNTFKLIRFGRIGADQEDSILNFTGLDTAFDNSPTTILRKTEKMTASFDGISIPLDENWVPIEESKTAILNFDNERYSYINIQTVSNDKMPPNAYQFLNWHILNSKAFIIPESVEIYDFKGIPTLKFVVYDEKSLKKTVSVIMLYNRGDFTSILTFGSYLNFYTDNKAYFDKILF